VDYHNEWSLPHRGGLILGLGISGVVFSLTGFFCCALLPVVSLGLSLPAWIMGRRDLQAIEARTMDPTGHGSTRAGMILGIIGTILGGLATLAVIAMFALYLGMFLYGLNSSLENL
jgi:hypothetical protein